MENKVEFAKFTVAEQKAVDRIIERAAGIAERYECTLDRKSMEMDLAATHAHTPLRLVDLAEADDFNFVHDVFGIQAHIDRKNGELAGHFLPRFSR